MKFLVFFSKCVNHLIFQAKGYLDDPCYTFQMINYEIVEAYSYAWSIKKLTFIVDTHCSCIIHAFFLSLLCHWLLPSPHAWFLNNSPDSPSFILHRMNKKCDNNKNHSNPIKEILQETQGAITMSSSQSNASKASGKNPYFHFCKGYIFWIVILQFLPIQT